MGSSWVTSALGYVVIFMTWLNQAFIEQGIPKTGKEWIVFVTNNAVGMIGVFAKDWNKSNAPKPDPTAHQVS